MKKPNDFRIDNAHPISVLSNIGKLFKRIHLLRTEKFQIRNRIPNQQFDFKRGHSSSVDALVHLHNEVICNLRDQKCTITIFMYHYISLDLADPS